MTKDEDRERFSSLTALVTLAVLGLFVYLTLRFHQETQISDPDSSAVRTKRLDVESRNQAVLDGKEAGTRPMAEAMPEFLAKQKAGMPPFPLQPPKKP